MTNTKIYLASASPRRREILETAGYSPVIIKADADESEVVFKPGHPEEYVMALAKLKNDAASVEFDEHGVIITADTVVVGDDMLPPLGKPKSREEAVNMLTSLSGRSHRVLTGVMLRDTHTNKTSHIEWSSQNGNPSVGGFFMNIVVVRSPKYLRGLLRKVFGMR